MRLEDEKEQAVGKAPGKNIPGRWKHICKDPETDLVVWKMDLTDIESKDRSWRTHWRDHEVT